MNMNSLSPTSPSTQNPNPSSNTNAIPNVSRSWEDADSEDDSTEDEDIPSQFNFQQFLGLAEKVIDHGDVESFAILERLRVKWEARFGKAGIATADETIEGSNMPPDLGPTAPSPSGLFIVKDIIATVNGFYFFQFKIETAMEEVIEGGPWLFQGQSIVLQRWEPSLALRKYKNTQVPIWIKLRQLPIEFWTNEGLSTVASGIGRPLYPDAITKACTRLDFARVCVMLDITSKLSKHIVIMVPKEDGVFIPRQKVENKGSKDDRGMIWEEPINRDTIAPSDPVMREHVREQPVPLSTVGDGKGKEIVIYNPFEVLTNNGDGVECSTKGPKQNNPQVLVFVIYGANDLGVRRDLWSTLSHIDDSIDVEPWLVLGDFNTVADMSEMCDRWPSAFYASLTPHTLDHSPLILKGNALDNHVSMFKFDNYLASSPDFIPSVHNIWKHHIVGIAMYSVTQFLEIAQSLLQGDRHSSLLLHLEHCCRLVYMKPVKQEQIMLQQRAKIQWLKGGDQCTRVFFRKVASRHASKRIFQITDDDGQTRTTPGEIIREFIGFYRSLLGGEPSTRFINLMYLRPWANHIVTVEESQRLLKPVTNEDIRLAIFDIAEDKSLGPDDYSSGFYKPTGPVIGEEVTRAIMEFFSTGRLLRQLNATLLALILKVQSPSTDSEFRPISCCNVLYKAITKILVQRIREVLDKIISPSQNAFVPGRSIADNILLAQELFTGYN
ncbi:UNVERIFIED_CONTAM: hypothetical protein Slati_2913600 [Sesamum latifolium]|uniref:Reverse transcriptase domain-containing protein n=1 Tax=Sesamum latifolium TaxID=2727402 RepID=A0AAW2VDR6_9LAMI